MRSDSGFTLVEVLVAFAIMAVLLATLFPALTGPMRATATNDGEYRAVLWAESLLDAIGVTAPLQAGEYSGSIDETTRWRARIRRIGTTGTGTRSALSAYEVVLSVTVQSAGRTADATLATVRLQREAPR